MPQQSQTVAEGLEAPAEMLVLGVHRKAKKLGADVSERWQQKQQQVR